MHATTAISPERLGHYAETAATFGDFGALVSTISQICTDLVTLEREGRTTAARGARHLLAGVVRRLCATPAWCETDATHKIALLAAVGQRYRETGADVLTAAMVDAAIGLETQRWFAASARH